MTASIEGRLLKPVVPDWPGISVVLAAGDVPPRKACGVRTPSLTPENARALAEALNALAGGAA